jgi:hypothetical protein
MGQGAGPTVLALSCVCVCNGSLDAPCLYLRTFVVAVDSVYCQFEVYTCPGHVEEIMPSLEVARYPLSVIRIVAMRHAYAIHHARCNESIWAAAVAEDTLCEALRCRCASQWPWLWRGAFLFHQTVQTPLSGQWSTSVFVTNAAADTWWSTFCVFQNRQPW